MGRGDTPSILREKPTPPEGIPGPGKIYMVHPGKGYRWIEAELRREKELFGYEFVRAFEDEPEKAEKPKAAEKFEAKVEAMEQDAAARAVRAGGRKR